EIGSNRPVWPSETLTVSESSRKRIEHEEDHYRGVRRVRRLRRLADRCRPGRRIQREDVLLRIEVQRGRELADACARQRGIIAMECPGLVARLFPGHLLNRHRSAGCVP